LWDSVRFFPLVGLLIGLILAAVSAIAGLFLPAMVVSAVVLIALTALTGGMHLDGLADASDGLFSGLPRERALQVMKDGPVGAMGSMSITLVVLLKFSCIASMGSWFRSLVVALMPVAGRHLMVLCMAAFPPARTDQGLGRGFALGVTWKDASFATAVSLALIIGLGFFLNSAIWVSIMIAFSSSIVSGFCISKKMARRLDGMTGDTYGAAGEVTEALFLVFVLILRRLMNI